MMYVSGMELEQNEGWRAANLAGAGSEILNGWSVQRDPQWLEWAVRVPMVGARSEIPNGWSAVRSPMAGARNDIPNGWSVGLLDHSNFAPIAIQ
jgi:hypothetical protein